MAVFRRIANLFLCCARNSSAGSVPSTRPYLHSLSRSSASNPYRNHERGVLTSRRKSAGPGWPARSPAGYNGSTLPKTGEPRFFKRFGAGAREKFCQPRSAA